MRKEILFASHNIHKVNEVRSLLPHHYHLLDLNDIGWNMEIPEPFMTFEENAKAKAYFVFDRTGIACFADDSGLEIDALGGRPGVFSARYAGAESNSENNMAKVLKELDQHTNRRARFQCHIAFITTQHEMNVFKGSVEGSITFAPMGTGGFGYDPIFIPDGFDKTFGQLPESLKNRISHRALAMRKFIDALQAI